MRTFVRSTLLVASLVALGACGQGAGLAHTPGAYSCTGHDQGKVMWCMVFPASYRGGAVEGKRDCEIAPGSTFGDTCPSDKLVGCCTETGAVGPVESCFYTDGEFVNDPAKCAAKGGVWSSAP
jgi:hypothetical protein